MLSNLTIFYLNHYILKGNLHNNLLDKNILTDYAKLRALVVNDKQLNGNYSVLTELITNGVITSELVDIFPMEAIHDESSFKSLLFYLGLITIKDKDMFNDLNFIVPNKTIQDIHCSYIRQALSESFDFKFKDALIKNGIKEMFKSGNALPALNTVTNSFYDCASLRDFVKHELSFKAYLLAYLSLSPAYNIFSEREFNKGYADIYLEPNLNLIEKSKFCFLIELKYIQAKEKTEKNISDLEEQATRQLMQYSQDSYFKDKALKKIILILSSTQIEVLKEVE